MNNNALESHIKLLSYKLNEIWIALLTHCLTERNLLALSNATVRKLFRINIFL